MRLDALVMAGGRGRRFTAGEKPLAEFRGRPLIEHVLRALKESRSIRNIIILTSPLTRRTAARLQGEWKVVTAPGRGYVEDLAYAFEALGLGKTLVVAADLPLIKSRDIDLIVREYAAQKEPAMAVMLPLGLYRELGLTPSMAMDNLVPAGVNVVDGSDPDGPERVLVLDNPRLAFNINTPEDLRRAENSMR